MFNINYKKWIFYQNISFTGLRYVSIDNITFLPAFALWNVSVGKYFQVRKQKITIQLRLNNFLDKAYQNYENRAMAGRNYILVLSIN